MHAIFEGNYKDGKRAGVGKMTYPNGDEYTGEWKDNAMEGEGTYIYKVGLVQSSVAIDNLAASWPSLLHNNTTN